MLCYVMLCYVMLCYVMLCYIILYYIILYYYIYIYVYVYIYIYIYIYIPRPPGSETVKALRRMPPTLKLNPRLAPPSILRTQPFALEMHKSCALAPSEASKMYESHFRGGLSILNFSGPQWQQGSRLLELAPLEGLALKC